MRKIGLIILLLTCFKSQAQDFDNLMTKKQLDCSDISYNCSLLYEKYFTENQLDSAKNLLSYWESKCGNREPIQRAKLLLALREKNYQDSLLTEGVLSHIFNYQNRNDMIKHSNFYHYDEYKPYYGFIPVGQEFDNFTRKEFENLKSEYDADKIEYLWCEFYSDNCDTIFPKLQSNRYETNTLNKEYDKAVKQSLNMSEIHLAWITGIWMPTGRLKTLGMHPDFGLQVGSKHKKMNYDLTMTYKFLKSANEYYAKREETGELEITDNFYGVYFGFDVGRDIYTVRGHELQLTGGVAVDIFTALKENKDMDIKVASANSYNFNMGIGYRYYIKSNFYLGLKAKYNIVDYTMSNVVDLKGNVITVQFVIGVLTNEIKNNNLKALKYKYRK
ncbi:MAG: hypothetical protein LBT27_08905 [Prevotellaceae bacterium]|jgi:hypothetical protein|nr:hypothetical protein [Prevotellaceae bacterium]